MKAPRISTGGVQLYTTGYAGFKGVDFSSDPAKVSASRSPDAINLISDAGGWPEKRPGWRTLLTLPGSVNGIFSYKAGGAETLIAHAGTGLYRFTEGGESELLLSGLSDHPSVAMISGEKLYILTGGDYVVYDGSTAAEVTGYIPLTTFGRAPAGGGTAYEPVNLLQPKRQNSFLSDGTSKVYQLDTDGIDGVESVTVNGAAVTGYTVNASAGTVTFGTAPAGPQVAGRDNVFILFSKTVAGYRDRIAGCTVMGEYQGAFFATGNPAQPAFDYRSALSDPTYFPDTGYSRIGMDQAAIMGYLKIGAYQAIVKEESGMDTTIFLRKAAVMGSETVFPVEPGLSGIGAVSNRGFATLIDEPLFLTRLGVYAVTTSEVTFERTMRDRSYFINARLKTEDLKNAILAPWNGYLLIAVPGGRMYVLDGKRDLSEKSGRFDSGYEGYFWENMPASCLSPMGDRLYFGCADGRICKMNTDVEGIDRFSDDGDAILARWSTKADDDGDFMKRKTLKKKGAGVMIKPYTRSSCKIYLRTEKDFGKLARQSTMDIFDWEDIDFERFTFSATDAPQVVPLKTKVKKYITLQIIVENDQANEGFGVYGIIKRYTRGSDVK